MKSEKLKKLNGFTIIEVSVVFLLILGVTFFILPMALDDTKQANLISKWKEVYNDTDYMFSVIKAQDGDELKNKLSTAPNDKIRTEIVIQTIRPYLRIKNNVQDTNYKQYYMNKQPVNELDRYYVDSFYYTDSGNIVGVKWFTNNCDEETICGITIFDINGTQKPNTWGKDIFGINILKNNIEPIGKDVASVMLKNDCSEYGHGLYCSYYYLIGGQFD